MTSELCRSWRLKSAICDECIALGAVVQKYFNALKEAGRIERVGGKRYGHWEILE